MYAILDIETTGGKFDEEGITEIAIYQFDGHQVIDQFSSLVNPERKIQPFVEKLTGINNQMLRSAPRFFEIAKRIIEITEGCILVAHNAEFDYRILQTEFRRLGYTFNRKSLCTVSLSQLLLPEETSFKLGKLVRSLGIPISDRHRAQGDALATLKLFQLLLEKDSKKTIVTEHVKQLHKKEMSQEFYKIIETLPTETGVYYLYGKDNQLLYIGKSKNIRKRVSSHLTSKTAKAKKIQLQLVRVAFEKTGCEFIARLKEQHEIKVNQPPFNHASKYRLFPMGICIEKDTNGYNQLILEQVVTGKSYLKAFRNKKAGIGQLWYWMDEYALCENKTSLSTNNGRCKRSTIKKCSGSCEGIESSTNYNERVQKLVDELILPQQNCIITSKGREAGEYGFLLLEKGQLKGYGYYDLYHQINSLEKAKSRLTTIGSNEDSKALLLRFIKNEKYHKLLPLNETKTSV